MSRLKLRKESPRSPLLSVIVPLYNEEENVERTVEKIVSTLDGVYADWELVLVDDGSTDKTSTLIAEATRKYPMVRAVTNPSNRGVGGALKAGFLAARGELLATLDGDLSYAPKYVIQVVEELIEHPEADLVIGSPYMRGGGTRGVPWHRLLLSRAANKLLCWSLSCRLSTVTGILCAYRRRVLEQIEVHSEGKEIHMEMISKAVALDMVVREVPAVLEGRQFGSSKINIRRAIVSHLLFTFQEKPSMLFGLVGMAGVFLGLAIAGYLTLLLLEGRLDPERPLIILTVVLLLGGLQLLSFGFIATQITMLRNEIYRAERAFRKPVQAPEDAQDVRHSRRLA